MFVGRLTYWSGPGFSPSTFIGIHENRELLEQWGIEKWNEMMPHMKIKTADELRKIHKRNSRSEWAVWERVPGRIQMHYVME